MRKSIRSIPQRESYFMWSFQFKNFHHLVSGFTTLFSKRKKLNPEHWIKLPLQDNLEKVLKLKSVRHKFQFVKYK